jgi:hypothetical protein
MGQEESDLTFVTFEREMISERTRDKIAGARRRGKWTGGPTPFGYRVQDKKLVVDEVEAQVVREMYRLFLEHRQMARVAQLLNERGLLPRGIASRPARGGLRWRKESVSRLLKCPLYTGQMPYGNELHPGEHEPLIESAVFRQAQLIIEGKRGAPQRPGLNPDYVLRGLLRCSKCGVMMCPGSTKHGRRTHRYYRCATRDKFGTSACPARALPASAIEEFVVQRIGDASLHGEFSTDVHRTLTARIEKRRAEATELHRQLPERVATAADHAKRLTEQSLRLNGRARELVEAQLVVESDRLAAAERQLAEATADLEALDAAQAEAEWLVGTLRDFDRIWHLLTPENQGRLLRALVAEVRVDEDQGILEVELIDFTRQGAKEAA